MKNLLFILFTCLGLSAAAQMHRKEVVRFGDYEDGATVSIIGVMDKPVLISTDTNQKIVRYEFTVMPEETSFPRIFKIEGAELNAEAMSYLRDLAGESGIITIGKVMTQKEDYFLETPYFIELRFIQ